MTRPSRTAVVIAGGGVAALEAALALHELAEDRVDIELVAPEPLFWYRPVAVAEPFGLGEVRHFDLGELAEAAGAVFTLGALDSVDVVSREAHLTTGAVLEYDALLLACGGIPRPAVPGALTFRGPVDTDAFGELLAELENGAARRVAFVVPWGATWALPAYELALMTAAWVERRGLPDVELSLVTPEDRPLELFGRAATEAVGELLDDRSIAIHTRAYASDFGAGYLRLVPDGAVPAERVVALPRVEGQRIDGITQTIDNFVATDAHARVLGLEDVYAAGDITTFPVKQGGIAAQQADVAAEAIAAQAGADVSARPFEPILRGLLLTGSHPQYLRRDLTTPEAVSWVSETPLWWPPTKIVGRRLSPFLAGLADGRQLPEEPSEDALRVEIPLGRGELDVISSRSLQRALADVSQDDESPHVGELMSPDPLIVEPEDTLGEVAERMRATDAASALVTEFGHLIGILTARDLLRALAGRTHSSEARVRQWMTADPIAVTADATADEARLLMTQYGIHHLPVVDGNRPVGMIGLRAVSRTPMLVQPRIGLGF